VRRARTCAATEPRVGHVPSPARQSARARRHRASPLKRAPVAGEASFFLQSSSSRCAVPYGRGLCAAEGLARGRDLQGSCLKQRPPGRHVAIVFLFPPLPALGACEPAVRQVRLRQRAACLVSWRSVGNRLRSWLGGILIGIYMGQGLAKWPELISICAGPSFHRVGGCRLRVHF
jgi:hypothetical protein